jgi:ABC-type nitrate/sulfonate/bicarbonate transport system substrate-binding protein
MKTFYAVMILFSVAFVSSPCGGLARAALAAEPPTLEMALPDDGVFGLGGQYLIDKGLDKKNGFIIKPRWAPVAEAEKLLAIGAVPLGLATAESAVRANLNNIPIRLIQPYMTPHNSVVVRNDAPYKSLKDLKDKPFAVPPEVTSAYNNFDYIMKKQGINIEKYYKLKKIGAPGMYALLERGEVEAAYSWEAHVSKLLVTGKYRVLVSPREEMNRLLNTKVKILGWVGALDSWIGKNQSFVAKFRAAWQEMIKGVQSDEEHFKKYGKRFFGLEKPDELKLGWTRTRQFLLPPDFPWPDKTNLDIEKRYLKESVELGIFAKEGLGVIDAMFAP